MNEKAERIYKNLENQIKKINKHNNQGSFKTKERYYTANQRFCKFLAQEFRLQKFSNISDKHLDKYIQHMRDKEYSISTIKTDLGAIRFYHDKVQNPKYTLSGNSKFSLERRQFGGVERSWSKEEYRDFKKVCSDLKQDRINHITTLARNEGLRIHETFKIKRNHVEEALKSDSLYVKGKGGKERYVPLTKETKDMLKEVIKEIPRGERVFIKDGEKTHLVIKQVQNFLNRHRDKWQQEGRQVNRTFHGLRHLYAREQYDKRISEGLNDYQARKEVSKLLGHERDEVTRIYLVK